jgi:hypothetical protein
MSIPSLDNVRVDASLYNLYAAEFDAFAAIAGNMVAIVPEPSSALLGLGGIVWLRSGKTRR